MDHFIKNILLISSICLLAYLVFRSIGVSFPKMEGMENNKSEEDDYSSKTYGSNASVYATKLKTRILKMQDKSLVPKYKPDYENVIMNLDELTDHLMLKSAMSVDPNDPKSASNALNQIANLNHSKTGLNNIMKFIDGK